MNIEFSTFGGISFALILVAVAIGLTGNIADFMDSGSFIIVFCATFFITLACFSARDFFKSWAIIFKMVTFAPRDPSGEAMKLMKIAETTYKKGLLLIESDRVIKNMSPFFERIMTMAIDGDKGPKIEKLATQEIMATIDAHKTTVSILRKAAEIAPAMGLIGTLIGLVQMLGSLSDVKMIGPAMAVALLTTFYGAILAYMILFPLASKLERISQIEILNNDLCLKAVLSMVHKENPRQLEQALNSLLPNDKKIIYYSR